MSLLTLSLLLFILLLSFCSFSHAKFVFEQYGDDFPSAITMVGQGHKLYVQYADTLKIINTVNDTFTEIDIGNKFGISFVPMDQDNVLIGSFPKPDQSVTIIYPRHPLTYLVEAVDRHYKNCYVIK